MSQFLEAQRRFHANPGAPVGQYVRDIMQNYGDGGRRINLPQTSKREYDELVAFRQREKNSQLRMQQELQRTRQALHEQKKLTAKFANVFSQIEFLADEQPDAPPGDRDSGVDPGGDSGAGVLHAEDRPNQSDTDLGEPKTIISGNDKRDVASNGSVPRTRRVNESTKKSGLSGGDEDERSNVGRNRPRRDGPDERKSRETRFEDTEVPDPGRAQPDATDAPEPDVDRQSGEHSVEE